MLRQLRRVYWFVILTAIVASFNAFDFHFNSTQDLQSLKSDLVQQIKIHTATLSTSLSGDPNETADTTEYVQIDGKYYPYQKSGIYHINGKVVYYRDGSLEKKVEDTINNSSFNFEPSIKGLNPYSPANLANISRQLEQAKRNLQERNQALDELMKQ